MHSPNGSRGNDDESANAWTRLNAPGQSSVKMRATELMCQQCATAGRQRAELWVRGGSLSDGISGVLLELWLFYVRLHTRWVLDILFKHCDHHNKKHLI